MDAGGEPRRRGRPRGHLTFVVVTAVAAAALGGAAAVQALQSQAGRDAASVTPRPSPFVTLPGGVRATADDVHTALAFAHGEGTRVLFTIPIDGSFGSFANLPADGVPEFGAAVDAGGAGGAPSDVIRWAERLGTYYGVGVWITGLEGADAANRELCLVIELETGAVRARCAPRPLWELGALVATVSPDELTAEERPESMSDADVLAFWWTEDSVAVLQGTPRPSR